MASKKTKPYGRHAENFPKREYFGQLTLYPRKEEEITERYLRLKNPGFLGTFWDLAQKKMRKIPPFLKSFQSKVLP
jgi:hypothetical protein